MSGIGQFSVLGVGPRCCLNGRCRVAVQHSDGGTIPTVTGACETGAGAGGGANSLLAVPGPRRLAGLARPARRRLVRAVALDGHSVAGADLRVVIPDRQMLDAAIIPKSDTVRLPLEAGLEVRFLAMAIQEFQNVAAFVAWQIKDMGGEIAVDV